MRYHTKEYYRLMMAQGRADCYEPIIDKDVYTEEDIAELHQQAQDEYVEEERTFYDAPPEYMITVDDMMLRDKIYALAVDVYENREPFDEENAKAEFEEMYRDSLEAPDEDLPDWVREAVDPRILAMDLMPEKIYRKLSAEDEANEKSFDELADAADEALEACIKKLPREYREFTEVLEDLEELNVVSFGTEKGRFGEEDGAWLEILMVDWDDEGKEIPRLLRFLKPDLMADEGIKVIAWKDEDGDSDSDCEFIFGELYLEDGKPEFHMLFDNSGLKYLTFRCEEAVAEYGLNNEKCRIGKIS